MMPVDELWWSRVPTAERMVKNARDILLAYKSMQIFPDMVWKETFLVQVLTKIRNIDAALVDFTLDGSPMDQNTALIDNIADQLGFGFNFDGSLDTLLEQLEGNTRYIWIAHGLSKKHLNEAHQLIRELGRRHAHISVVLEDDTQAQVKSLSQIKLKPTRMDVHYFAWTLLMEQSDVPLMEYAAVLCEELSGGDLARCAALCEHIHELLKDARTVCDWLSEDEILKAVHLAQLRGVQPVIEQQRLRFIAGLGSRIEQILPFEDEYSGRYTSPREVELRHLIFFRRDLSLTQAELSLLNQLYEARNDLAHLKILSEDMIKGLAALWDS